MPRVVFVGDTSLHSPHFGCQLVGQSFREQFARAGLELVASLPTRFDRVHDHKRILADADLVVINGEGSIHHGKFQNLIDLAVEYPAALVNCVYQENPPNENLKRFRLISARESFSAKAVEEHGAECRVTPDVLFDSAFLNSYVPVGPPEQDLGVTDSAEKIKRRIGPFVIRTRPGFSPKVTVPGDYLKFLTSYRRLCLGRFHAVVSASVLGIPFASWDSNTWKTRAMMEDIGVPHLHFDSRDEALAAVPSEFPGEIGEFAAQARTRIRQLFADLAQIAAG